MGRRIRKDVISMRDILMINTDQNAIRVVSYIPQETQERMEKLITSSGKKMAVFACQNLTVVFKAKSGSQIILKGM